MKRPNTAYRHRAIGQHRLRPETMMMGYGYEPQLSEGSVKCPIFMTSTFVFKNAEDGKAFFEMVHGVGEVPGSREAGLIYSRINNPDLQVLEERLTLWDEAEDGLVFSSGMSAIATTLLTFLRPGDTVVHNDPLYGGTEYLLGHVLPQFGVVSAGCCRDGAHRSTAEAIRAAAGRGRVGMIFIETPANPTNSLVDIAECARAAEALTGPDGRRPLVVVDNTFLGPLWQHPIEHGADLVVYSLTKYVGGHSDLIAGACLGSEEHINAVRTMRTVLGTATGPHTCWLLMRSLETLKLRMTSGVKNARDVAEFLVEHPKVATVHYLGFLTDQDPQYDVYHRQCKSPGSTFSFEVHGGEAEAFRLLNNLTLIKLAVSLGGTESLIEHPATMTHSGLSPDEQAAMGITPALVRISVGIEHPDDIIADLSQALDAV